MKRAYQNIFSKEEQGNARSPEAILLEHVLP